MKEKRSFLDKIICLLYLLQAVVREKDGQTEKADADLRKAIQIARTFDADPVYTLENVVFLEHVPRTVYVYDDAGPTTVDGLRATLDEAGDLAPASFRWKFEKEMEIQLNDLNMAGTKFRVTLPACPPVCNNAIFT